MILDKLAARKGFAFEHSRKWEAGVATHGGVHWCKPTSFMNLSGGPAAAIAGFYKIAPSEVLAVFDDVALPLGKLRFRTGGSAGGHNGMDSLIQHFGTREIPRLRIGIGAAEDSTMVGHVLGKFTAEEQPALNESIDRAADAIEFALANGLEPAMNRYN